MAIDLYRVRVILDGWQGGPGINTFHFRSSVALPSDSLDTVADMLSAAYYSLALYLVPGLTMRVDPIVDVFRDDTGELVRGESLDAPATVTMTSGAGGISRATQIVARFGTNDVKHGRRLVGRTFIGPASGQALGGDGLVTSACRTAVQGAFDGLLDVVGDLRLVVWHRPRPEPENPGDPPARAGDNGLVTSVTALPKPGVLRSRRD